MVAERAGRLRLDAAGRWAAGGVRPSWAAGHGGVTGACLRDEGVRGPQPDEEDLRRLADIIGIRTVAEALDVCTRFFPSEPMPDRAKEMVEDLFPEQA